MDKQTGFFFLNPSKETQKKLRAQNYYIHLPEAFPWQVTNHGVQEPVRIAIQIIKYKKPSHGKHGGFI